MCLCVCVERERVRVSNRAGEQKAFGTDVQKVREKEMFSSNKHINTPTTTYIAKHEQQKLPKQPTHQYCRLRP